jgi:hypothetical protein
LHREYLVDTFSRSSDLFEPLEPLNVRFDALASSTGPAAADGVGRLHENGFYSAYLDLVVVSLDGVHYVGMLAVLARQIRPDDRV